MGQEYTIPKLVSECQRATASRTGQRKWCVEITGQLNFYSFQNSFVLYAFLRQSFQGTHAVDSKDVSTEVGSHVSVGTS